VSNFSLIKTKITEILEKKYKNRVLDKEFIKADVTAVLLTLQKNKEILNFKSISINIKNRTVKISSTIYLFLNGGKIDFNMEINL
jgi:hypothetical protein